MREKFLGMMRDWEKINITESPNFITIKSLFEAFKKVGYNEEDAAKIAASVKVDVCQEFVDDSELFNKTIRTYVTMITNMRELFSELHPALFWGAMNSGEMSLKYRV